ncbi:hypothetical protein POM88_042408 [Heracleum sosnowskyi]|uniref:Uncharacterized protein n=1 Tax=Heracleum sosnowskyi TaxID=360622 RepID=A0AAD8HG56_9APIA|nr:hypothetical protein POM88_042408 [Heracleum sosnowskyi]
MNTKSSGIAKEIPGSNRSGKLRKEEEKVEILKRTKRKRASENEGSKVYKKKRKMMRPVLIMEKKIPLPDFYKMSRKRRAYSIEDEDDDDITVMEVYKKIKKNKLPMSRGVRRRPMSSVKKILLRSPISRKDEEEEIIEMSSSLPVSKKEMEIIEMSSSSPIPKKGKGDEIVEMNSSSALDEKQLWFTGAGTLFDPSSEEDSEEEKKHARRSPILVKRFSDRIILESSEIEESESEPESEEELLRECDRNEIDHGYNYVLKKRFRALTNFKNPEKVYYKSGTHYYPIDHVLHDPKYPLATLTKLALKTYNDIQGTQYEFVGFVKAYRRFTGGACYWIRFKACVLGQDAINFQTSIFEEIPDRKTNVVTVRVDSVFPLPPC